MITGSFVLRLLEESVPSLANLCCAEEQDQIISEIFELQLRRGQICAEEAHREHGQEASDTRRRQTTVKKGVKQSHSVAQKRPLTWKKERFDGCFVVFFKRHGRPSNGFSSAYLCHTPPPTPPSKPPGCTVRSSVCVTPLHSEGQCSRCQLPHKGSFQVSPGRTLPPSHYLTPPPPAPSTTNFWLVSSRSDARLLRSLKPCEQTTPPLIRRRNTRRVFRIEPLSGLTSVEN